MKALENKRILITGGTVYLGKVLVRRLLSGGNGIATESNCFLAR